jgi:hypothetical protein
MAFCNSLQDNRLLSPIFHAIPLVLTLACLRSGERDALLQIYTDDDEHPVFIPDEMKFVLRELMEHKDVDLPGGFGELMRIAEIAVSNIIVTQILLDQPILICKSGHTQGRNVHAFQVACMGAFPCSIRHPPNGTSGNVLMVGQIQSSHTHTGTRTILDETGTHTVVDTDIVLQRDMKAGEELTFDYQDAADFLV